ncbi:MAG: HAD family phosphatase, partial [Patescibacteria group bacterium]
IDTEPLNDLHMIEFLKKLGVDVSHDYLQRFRGTHAKDAWNQISKDFKLATPVDELIASVRISYLQYLTSLDLKPIAGVLPFLKKLKKEKIALAVASSAYHKRISILLEVCKLKDFFDVVVSGDHVQHSKPNPEIYLKTAQILKRDPKDCIVFEDATNGILAAKSAGMKVIGYKGGDHNKQDLSKADIVITTFLQTTPSLLEKL